MPDYKRIYIEGGTYFFTLATARRAPRFAEPKNEPRPVSCEPPSAVNRSRVRSGANVST